MSDLRKTARITGGWYLALALSGLFGFIMVRPAIYAPGDPAATAAHLVNRAALARAGVVLEFAIVVTQAATAVWFFKLFRGLNVVAAGALAGFGVVNAVSILASATCIATALTVATNAGLAPGGDVAATVQLLYLLSGNFWGVGQLFFGMWLLPMGYVAATSGRMPRVLGWILLAGGVGYVLAAAVSYGTTAPDWLAGILTVPASVGEFWMIGYLLAKGIRPTPLAARGGSV
jgi:hypothetical protein